MPIAETSRGYVCYKQGFIQALIVNGVVLQNHPLDGWRCEYVFPFQRFRTG